MATLGSVAGCYVIYALAEKGGEAFLQKRLKQSHTSRVLGLYQKHGLLALMIPALLPPPAPFKLFVLAAGVANVRPVPFVVAIAVARGARYLALGWLAITYGDTALDLMRTRRTGSGTLAGGCDPGSGRAVWLWNRRNAVGSAA
jgi:membrane protein YqaA with SNARE-associated domain